jgi:hypothetical protein
MMTRLAPAGPGPRPTPAQVAAWAAVFAAGLVLALHHLPRFQLGGHSDDAHYVVLARSLVEAERYGRLYLPGEPGLAHYPFGYPLLLAPLVSLCPGNYEVLKLVPFAATLFALALVFWGWPRLGRGASHWWAVGVAAVYGLAPLTIRNSGMLMSEAPFLAACLAALWVAEGAAQGRAGRAWPLWLGVALVAAVAIRTVGVALPLAVGAYLLYRRGRDALPGLAATLGAAALAVTLALALTPLRLADLWPASYFEEHAALVSGEGRQTSQDEPYLRLLARMSLRHLHTDLRNLIVPVGSGVGGQAFADALGLPWLLRAVGYGLAAVMGLGAALAVRRWGLSAFWSFALVYYLMMQAVLWTSHRLLFPIFPQLAFGLLVGAAALAQLPGALAARLARPSSPPSDTPPARLSPKTTAAAARALQAALLLALAGLSALNFYKSWTLWDTRDLYGDFAARSAWLAQFAPPDAVALSDAPHTDFLYSGRRMAPLGHYAAPAELEADLARWGAGYLVVGPGRAWHPADHPAPDYAAMRAVFDALLAAGRLRLAHDDPALGLAVFSVEP